MGSTRKTRRIRSPLAAAALIAITSWHCVVEEHKQLRMELQNSLRAYMLALKSRDGEALKATAFFPGVSDYRQHVTDLYVNYLDDGRKRQTVSLDPQGAVLCRFLGLLDHRYVVERVSPSEDGLEAAMRISVNFSYDRNIEMSVSQGSFEPGTKVFVPGEPLGKVHMIVIGEENPIPRQQLKRIEIDVKFRKTNRPGVWQVRTMTADEEAAEYETSLQDTFS